MKKNILGILLFFILISCTNNVENKLKEILVKKFSVTQIEVKEYKFYTANISDREYCESIIKMYRKRQSINYEAKYIDSLLILKGNKKYKEVLYFRLKNNDTIAKGYLYFNEKDKLIKYHLIK